MSQDPVIGMEVSGLVGSSATIVTDSGLRGAQISNALVNQGVSVELQGPSSQLAAGFHKTGVPEQPIAKTGAIPQRAFVPTASPNA